MPLGSPSVVCKRRFSLVLVKPTHYCDDGYPIRWFRSAIPSNSLACIYGSEGDLAVPVPMGIGHRTKAAARAGSLPCRDDLMLERPWKHDMLQGAGRVTVPPRSARNRYRAYATRPCRIALADVALFDSAPSWWTRRPCRAFLGSLTRSQPGSSQNSSDRSALVEINAFSVGTALQIALSGFGEGSPVAGVGDEGSQPAAVHRIGRSFEHREAVASIRYRSPPATNTRVLEVDV